MIIGPSTGLKKSRGRAERWYICRGETYDINETMCDGRQAKGWFEGCKKCPLRKGGSDDPRTYEEESGVNITDF